MVNIIFIKHAPECRLWQDAKESAPGRPSDFEVLMFVQ